jgi:hypothetical protein
MPLPTLLAIAGAFLSGCLNLTPPVSVAEAHGLMLSTKSSACVQVNGPRLQMNKGHLELAGSIAKKPGAGTTAFSHLDILFCDASGRIVQTKPIRFTPRSVGQSRFGSRLGYYSIKLEPLPDGTARIEVQAHDGDIVVPHS